MGMFNYIIPDCHLPEFPEEIDQLTLEWQTKDLEPLMLDTFRIRVDGMLEHQDYDIEDQSDPNAKAGSLESLGGICTPVNKRWVLKSFTGSINFYTLEIGYMAFFDEGKMFKIKQTSLEKGL